MKKIILFLMLLSGLYLFCKDDSKISDDSIRFRVIANSNSVEDIRMKELVVKELSSTLFKENSLEGTRSNIISNISQIEKKIDKVFDNNNYDKTYNVIYGMNEFPEKVYNGVVYEKGLYESLVVEIGYGAGNNYWCFLYPSLCLIDYEENVDNFKYKSKIVEIIDKLF